MPDTICDTSPLQYLYQTGHLDLLPKLYQSIIVPIAVQSELDQGRALGYLVPDVRQLAWAELLTPPSASNFRFPLALGPGERGVIELALAISKPLVIIDDELARRFARELGLPVTGTLGVLLKAKQEGLLSRVGPILDQLVALHFRVSATTLAAVLKLAGEANGG